MTSAPPVLVSCIMPTAGRPQWVAHAVRYFQRQDYGRRELLIVYERASDLPSGLDDPRLVLIESAPGASIGAKRNLALRHAAGAIVVQWDDDDWFGAARLSAQVAPLLRGEAEISGLTGTLFLGLQEGVCWEASQALYRRMFVENVAGGTLAYLRTVWQRGVRYPDTSLREDADFLLAAMARGARLARVPGRELYLYVRHGANTWRFSAGQFLQPDDWRRLPLPACLGADAALYAAQAQAPARCDQPPADAGAALVSCIMPTAGRAAFVPQAIGHFLRQDYPNKELIIVDDGALRVDGLIPPGAPIRYLRLDRPHSLGAKRNLACEMAAGSIIAHWDDDDWMAPGWLSSQVHTLESQRADLCGLDKVLFHAPGLQRAWKYVYDGVRPWVCGGTLCYTRALWERNRFPDITVGEDNAFIWSRAAKRIAVNGHLRRYVATIHAANTSPKQTTDRRWHAFPVHEIVRLQSNFT